MKHSWLARRIDIFASLTLVILPALLYPLAALRQGVFYVGDIFRLYYPQRAVYAAALHHGHVPLWTPDVLSGFPLLAEGQTGVFYPLNLFLYRFLPIDVALNYSILLALSLAGIATYLLGRTLRQTPPAAVLTAVTFTYGGFFVGHFNHLNIMAAAPWLPLQLAIVEKFLGTTRTAPAASSGEHQSPTRRHTIAFVALLGTATGVQFLAGHPQIWLMSALVTLAFAGFRAVWPAGGRRRSPADVLRLLVPAGLGIAVGLSLAAVQLLPTLELVQHSVRAGGLTAEAFAQFSWHPALLTTLVVPFALGNPYPNVSVELAGYLGLLPLALAGVSIALKRDRLTVFMILLGLVSLGLAFGDYTPFYALLARIPVLNLFRVPARFLYPFSLAIAVLSGRGLDALLARYAGQQRRISPRAAIVVGGGTISGVVAIRLATLDTLLALRWALPALTLGLVAALLSLAWRRRIARRPFIWAALGLTLLDLYAFGAVYRLTYNDLMPLDQFYDNPRSIEFFPEDTADFRTLTHQAIVPALSVMRASLYPNVSLLHSISSANGYFPLLSARHARYLENLTPGRLNLLNARYFLIPQLLPVDPETERYDLHNPFTPDLVGETVDIPPTPAEAVELISFTSQSAGWAQGELVAEIVLHSRDGSTITLPVRAGEHTAEWAYDRSDVVEQMAHERPPVAQTWPARSGFPPQDHPGHAYLAHFQLPQPLDVTQVQIVSAKPAGLFHVAQLSLVAGSQQHSMAELLGAGHHQLVYRDPDVVIYENLDALPRAFVVEQARVVPDDETALALIDMPAFDPRSEVLLSTTESLPAEGAESSAPSSPTPAEIPLDARAEISLYSPRRVEIDVESDAAGYLVLLDSHYPGWRAEIDGRPVPIQRADVLFRAVAVDPGRHTVAFVYEPQLFKLGAVVSVVTLLVLAMTTWTLFRRP